MDRRDFLLGLGATGTATTTKLAAAAEDDSLISSGIRVVPTIADLRRRRGRAPEDVVWLRGYRTAGDGAEGFFRWEADATEADDSGTIIAPAGTGPGRWRRPHDGTIDARWFGITGGKDIDVSPALQALLHRVSAEQWSLFVPAGIYELHSTINISLNTKLIGAGRSFQTVFRPKNVSAFSVNGAVAGEGGYAFFNTLEDFMIWPLDTHAPASSLIHFDSQYSNILRNIRFHRAGGAGAIVSIRIDGGNDLHLENIVIYGGSQTVVTGIKMTGGSAVVRSIDIEDCAIGIHFLGGLLDVHTPYIERTIKLIVAQNGSAVSESRLNVFGGVLESTPASAAIALYDCSRINFFGTALSNAGSPGAIYGSTQNHVKLYAMDDSIFSSEFKAKAAFL